MPTWTPLTPELLTKIDAGDFGNGELHPRFWLAAPRYSAEPIVGRYEWQQGRNPHWFITAGCGEVNAVSVTHVMPYEPPAMPSIAHNDCRDAVEEK